jgi:hypothetical protein
MGLTAPLAFTISIIDQQMMENSVKTVETYNKQNKVRGLIIFSL